MSQDWMIDVLQDLRNFVEKNELTELAEQLDDTIHIAVAELTIQASSIAVAEQHAKPNGSVLGTRGAM
ncbi:MAG: hypothetical protein QNK92_09980 [Amylibacter sp.]